MFTLLGRSDEKLETEGREERQGEIALQKEFARAEGERRKAKESTQATAAGLCLQHQTDPELTRQLQQMVEEQRRESY